MSKEDIIRKLTSRKFWAAVCSFLALLWVAIGHSEGEAAQMTALVMAGASVLCYIIGEGMVDAARKSGEGILEEAEYEDEEEEE